MCVGQVNSQFIREYLSSEGIPIDAEDLEGSFGRVIHFSNGDFTVHRRKINVGNSRKLVLRDRDCWQQSIESQNKSLPAIDLW
jgi:chemotaxis protein CheD